MERRFVLALLLSAGVLFLWPVLFPQPKKPTPPATPVAAAGDPAAPVVAPGTAPAVPGANPPVAPAAEPSRKQDAKPAKPELTPKVGEFLRVAFTTRGAAVRRLTLRNAYEFASGEVPKGKTRQHLDVILPVDDDLLMGMTTLDDADTQRMRTLDWTIESQSDAKITFTFLTTDGLRVKKTYTLPTEPDRYDLGIDVAVERVEGAGAPDAKQTVRLLGVAGVAHEPDNHVAMKGGPSGGVQPVVQVIDTHDEPLHAEWSVPRVELTPVQRQTRAFRLVGVSTPYFLASVWTAGEKNGPLVNAVWVDGGDRHLRNTEAAYERLVAVFAADGRPPAEDRDLAQRLLDTAIYFHRAWVEFNTPVATTGTTPASSAFQVYVGPLARTTFGRDPYDGTLSALITYPAAPDLLARFLLFIYDLWKGLTGSSGLAIVLMTLCVRGGLMPLSIRNQLGMRTYGRKMAKLKPKLDALRERLARDPKRLREEQAKLMKEHGVGFPLGCLMMLLQIPIFFSLFSSLRVEYDIRHQAFGWITDLAGPDRLVDFGRSLFDFLPPGGFRGINLLPLVYIALTIYQQRLMPPAQDAQQAQQMKMAKWMSIIFSVLLYNYTAALALYMCVSSLVALIEGRIVRAKDRAASQALAEARALP